MERDEAHEHDRGPGVGPRRDVAEAPPPLAARGDREAPEERTVVAERVRVHRRGRPLVLRDELERRDRRDRPRGAGDDAGARDALLGKEELPEPQVHDDVRGRGHEGRELLGVGAVGGEHDDADRAGRDVLREARAEVADRGPELDRVPLRVPSRGPGAAAAERREPAAGAAARGLGVREEARRPLAEGRRPRRRGRAPPRRRAEAHARRRRLDVLGDLGVLDVLGVAAQGRHRRQLRHAWFGRTWRPMRGSPLAPSWSRRRCQRHQRPQATFSTRCT